MKIVPIRGHGSARVERLRALLEERLRTWLEQWAVAPARIDCTLARLAADDADADAGRGEQWLGGSAARGVLWLRTGASALEQLGCRLAGAAISDGLGLAAGTGKRAVADLIRQVFALPAVELHELSRPIDAPDARHGWLGFVCRLDRIRIELHLDHRLCDALVPVAPPTRTLTPRSDAIGAAEITLRAVLDLGAINLQDTALLRPGEVIKTRVPLDRSIDVQTESGTPLLTGTLTAAHGHRALRLTRSSF